MENLRRIDFEDFEEIDSISQDGWQYDNPSITLYRAICNGDSHNEGDIVQADNDGANTFFFLLDKDEAKEALQNTSGWLQDKANDWANNEENADINLYLWGLKRPSDDEVDEDFKGSVKIVVERIFYGYSPIDYVKDDMENIIEFDSYSDAAEWIEEEMEGTYYLSHNEAGRPSYTIVAS